MNVVNKLTGEILDLKLLWRSPRTRQPMKRYQSRMNRQDHLLFTLTAGVLGLALGILIT